MDKLTGTTVESNDASSSNGAAADRRLSRFVPRLRTLQARFLAVNVPLIMFSLLVVFGLFEFFAYRISVHELHERIDKMVASQSGVLAESLWHLDHERIKVILDAILVDADIIGADVNDELGARLASAGEVETRGFDPHLIHGSDIVFTTTEGPEKIGYLTIVHSLESIDVQNRQRLIWGSVLAVMMTISAIVSALVANWRAIGVPLGRLRKAISVAEEAGAHATVDWNVRDEFGELVTAFNRMQAQQHEFEMELKEAHEDLERRVEERTHELRLARDEAETANRAKTEFLQSMSHELRTPLNAILGFSDFIRLSNDKTMSNEQQREYAGDIYKSAHFLLDIVNDLLDLSRIEAEAHEPDDDQVDPVAALTESLDMVRSGAEAKGIEIVCDLGKSVPAIIADERMIKQVFLNILSNAVKFTDQGGRIEASIETPQSGGLVFQFTDNGRGIAAEDMEIIFKPFNRVADPLISREEGTGLGLPLVKSLVELHDGTFEIESRLNGGTVARVLIPSARVLRQSVAG